jgi:hypothetical protein
LFDVVEGHYRFIASGISPTSFGAHQYNVQDGVRAAIDQLVAISGRAFFGEDGQLVLPSTPGGVGIDAFAVTLSAGPPVEVVIVGLIEKIDIESARRLVKTTYSRVMDVMSLNDRRAREARLDSILRIRPDLIVIVGGFDDGGVSSVQRLAEPVGLACSLMTNELKPEVLFAGNRSIQGDIRSLLGKSANLHLVPNLRPSIDVEQLNPAQVVVEKIVTNIRKRQIPGVAELASWAGADIIPTSVAFSRIIRFLSMSLESNKGVLGIDVGASATTIAASFCGSLVLNVCPEFGLGSNLDELLTNMPLSDITRWISFDIADDDVRNYLFNKSLYPSSLPVEEKDLAIEQAVARQVIRGAIKKAFERFPVKYTKHFLPWFEPIIATGSVLTQSPSVDQTALMLIDSLQPTGATTLVLDHNHLLPALGAAASINQLMVVHVLDTDAFMHLGTVITPVGEAPIGTPVLRLQMIRDDGQDINLEIKYGDLEMIPLPVGQKARLQLHPLHLFDVGMGAPGRGGVLRVMGGELGVIIDARGRPLKLPDDRDERSELLTKWRRVLAG